MRAKDAIGEYGERVAARFLVAAGWEILDRNWRCSIGELDIVARHGDALVFVEVKTRSSLAFGDPAEAVVGAKAVRLRRLAGQWIADHPGGRWSEIRIDVVAVLRSRSGPPEVRHLRAVA
jgi:putative endonuclease